MVNGDDPRCESSDSRKEGSERPRIVGIERSSPSDALSGSNPDEACPSVAENSEAKQQRKVRTADERALRKDEKTRTALDRALAEQDALDAQVRKSIRLHGA